MLSIDELVEGVRALSPAKRRQLLRRLRVNGLLDFDEPLTDHDALNISTALGIAFSDQATAAHLPASSSSVGSAPRSTADVQSSPASSDNTISESTSTSSIADAPPSEDPLQAEETTTDEKISTAERTRIDLTKGKHLAPSSGKVVVGAPAPAVEQPESTDDPHAMAPVPGEGPRGIIRLVFDGGSKGNPGYGYGSYALEWPGLDPQVVRLQHGNSVTNNEAEYDTLVKALETILKRLHAMGADPSTATIDIRGDSLLVINQVIGEWKCKHDRLKRRRDKIRAMLDQFEYWELRHHDRENSVRVLGH